MQELYILCLLLTVNAAPILVRLLLGAHWRQPLDGGRIFSDGHPLFGASKTQAGLAAAIAAGALIGWLTGLGASIGVLMGTCAMLGDLLSSFIKRRLGLAASVRALGLDQVPESLLPLLACAPLLDLSWTQISWLTLAFAGAELLLSRTAFHLGFKQHPY